MLKFIFTTQFKRVAARVAEGVANLRKAQAREAREAAQLMVRALKKHAPVGVHYTLEGSKFTPETLKKSIRISAQTSLPQGTRTTIVAAEHAEYTLRDTPPHPIFPRSAAGARKLAFFWKNIPAGARERLTIKYPSAEGAAVFLPSVQHPGTKGSRWDLDAFREVERRLLQMKKNIVVSFAKEITKKEE